MNSYAIAFRTELTALWAMRSTRLMVYLTAGIVALFCLLFFIGVLDSGELRVWRQLLLVPGSGLVAIAGARLPIREGLSERTMLYRILTPVPRSTLVIVRTIVAILTCALVLSMGVLTLGLLVQVGGEKLALECLAALMSSVVYISLFSFFYLWTEYGWLIGIAFVFVDWVLGSVALAMRNIAPSAHVVLITGRSPVEEDLGVGLDVAASSISASVLTLLIIGLVFGLFTVLRFNRRDLNELC